MNPRVRSSPFSPPPADELILSENDVFVTRRRRLFFLSIHTLALAGLYLCVTGQVKLYTVLFGMFPEVIKYEHVYIIVKFFMEHNKSQNIHS